VGRERTSPLTVLETDMSMRFPPLARAALLAGLLLGSSGCASLVGPEEERRETQVRRDSPHEVVVDAVRARLSLDRTEIERTHPFVARLALTNPGSAPATWTSGASCLAFLDVYRDEKRYSFRGTDYACLAVVSSWEIAPGDSLVHEWTLHALTTDDTPLEAGEYLLVADLIRGSGLRLERSFSVR
jgi:hypothetical protein